MLARYEMIEFGTSKFLYQVRMPSYTFIIIASIQINMDLTGFKWTGNGQRMDNSLI